MTSRQGHVRLDECHRAAVEDSSDGKAGRVRHDDRERAGMPQIVFVSTLGV
jgi:hypothetical protein